jgi:hypothetical protein
VRLGDRPRDRQPEAGAGSRPRSGAVAAIEALEDAPYVVGHDAGSRVDHRDLGRGITGQQVRDAFEASRPASLTPGVVAFAVEPGEFVEALARALGVSVEQLRSALASIRPAVAPARP